MTTPVLLDTDIGTDIDDTIALAVVLGASSLHLVGLGTVYVDAPLRAQLARELLQRAHRQVDVWAGESIPIRPVPALTEQGIWEFHEGRGVLYDAVTVEEREYASGRRPRTRPYNPTPSDGVERLATAAAKHGPVTLVCIGPLTNLAEALVRRPYIADAIKAVTVMGGCFRDDRTEPQVEHNFAADPGAVEIVFASSLPLTVVSFDATETCYLLRDRALAACPPDTPLSVALGRLIEIYFAVKQRWRTSMHDPVAVLLAEDPSIGQTPGTEVFLDPANGGTSLTSFPGAIPRTVFLLRDVRVDRCEELIYERLACACGDEGR